MAEQYPYQIYTRSLNGKNYYDVLPATNTPFGSSPTDFNGVLSGLKSNIQTSLGYFNNERVNQDWARQVYGSPDVLNQQLSQLNAINPANLTQADYSLLSSLGLNGSYDTLKALAGGQTALSDKFIDPNQPGVPLNANPDTQAQQTATHEAAVAAGTEIKVPVGSGFSYIPTNSPGGQLATGQQTQAQQIQQGQNLPQNANTGPGIIGGSSDQVPALPPTPSLPPSPGLQFADVQAAQTANPPQYGQQGQVLNPESNQVPQQPAQQTGGTPSGLNFNEGQAANEANPPQYDQQGMLIPGTGGLKEQVDQQQQKSSEILSNNGIDSNAVIQGATYKNPYQTFIDTYIDILKQLGISDAKTQLEKVNKKYLDLQNQKADEIQKINDDPWLTEGIRLKKIDSINNRYEVKEKNLTGQIGNLQKIYSDGVDQAKFVAQEATNIGHNQSVLDQNLLIAKMNLAEKALEFDQTLALNQDKANAGTSDIQEYQYAVAQGYKGSLLDWQRENANLKAKASGAGLGGLFSAAQINASLNQIAGAFDNEPIVKQYNTIAETVNFVKNAGKTPTDDIGRIYAFAKIMDPNSAVREGEYKTVQDYSTSLLQRFGLKTARVFTNTGFLTDEARSFINSTLQNRLDSSYQNYQNVYNQYQQRQAKVLSGQGNTITDYSQAFNPTQENNVGGVDLSGLDFGF